MHLLQMFSTQMKRFKWFLLSLILFLIILTTGWYLWQRSYFPSTDDAYLNAHVVRIAAQVGGPVSRVEIRDQQTVNAGDLLFEIDPTPFQIALQQAEAQLSLSGSDVAAATAGVATARAQVVVAQAAYDEAVKNSYRTQALVLSGALSQADGDHTQTQRETTRAAVDAAQALLQQAIDHRGNVGNTNAQTRIALTHVAQARLNLSYTQVRAPVTGVISNLSLRPGSTVAEGEPLFALVDTQEWWVDANFKETDLRRIKPDQPVEISLDLYSGVTYKGQVESVSPASGSAFSLLPPENATGNWVKVTQRFPVKIRLINLDPALALRIGASTNVTIDTRGDERHTPEQP